MFAIIYIRHLFHGTSVTQFYPVCNSVPQFKTNQRTGKKSGNLDCYIYNLYASRIISY